MQASALKRPRERNLSLWAALPTHPRITAEEPFSGIRSERELAGLALALGARGVLGWSAEEEALAGNAVACGEEIVEQVRERIQGGSDPLGDAFCRLRTPETRRVRGATYTPQSIVGAMTSWAGGLDAPDRIVDPGSGSGRFLVAAARVFPKAHSIGIEVDPLAAMMTRANLAVVGATRSRVLLSDYRSVELGGFTGRTLFIGNPPYVRHHQIEQQWKNWLTRTAGREGLAASQLAGLHVHFFLATALHAKNGDAGIFVTAAEWLDVNYGSLVRKLFAGRLGGSALHVIEPAAMPFPDAASTAVIACFRVGERNRPVRVRRVSALADLGDLREGQSVPWEQINEAPRWTPITRPARKIPSGFVELGELCRVHRGQVTGDNSFWIAGEDSSNLPESVLFPAVTKAKELYRAGRFLSDTAHLRRVIDLPEDLDVLEAEERIRVDALLRRARAARVHHGYIASHRRAWWSVGLREPAPILATYMARRPPGFVRNTKGARHINIAHGIYPRETMADGVLTALATHLATHTSVTDGRTYAGGLTKFEPREMERLLVPAPENLV